MKFKLHTFGHKVFILYKSEEFTDIANYTDSVLQIKVEYFDSSEIRAFDLDDAIYVKGTLQIHHLESVTKSRKKFFFNSTNKKPSNILK